jgi:hypothetical protein
MNDTAQRLNTLNHQLTSLLGERRALQCRWMLAAAKANDWPDMHRARELFVSIQPASQRAAPDTEPPSIRNPDVQAEQGK